MKCTNEWCEREMDSDDMECIRCDGLRYDAMLEQEEMSEEELLEVQHG